MGSPRSRRGEEGRGGEGRGERKGGAAAARGGGSGRRRPAAPASRCPLPVWGAAFAPRLAGIFTLCALGSCSAGARRLSKEDDIVPLAGCDWAAEPSGMLGRCEPAPVAPLTAVLKLGHPQPSVTAGIRRLAARALRWNCAQRLQLFESIQGASLARSCGTGQETAQGSTHPDGLPPPICQTILRPPRRTDARAE
eukprot:gene4572-biopygen7864